MRLTRGKIVLRRLLAAELRDEAVAHGLEASDDAWRETRVWCTGCGRRRLQTRREPPPGPVAFRCPACTPAGTTSAFRLENPFFSRLLGGLVRPTAILARGGDWSRRYFAGGAGAEDVACTRCGRALRLRRYSHDRDGRAGDGLYADCSSCGEQVSSSVRGLALALPEVRRFGREHPRSKAVPPRAVAFAGVPAILVRHEDVLGSAGAEVVFERDTLRVLHVATC
jgi:hypothetical protein